MTAQFTKGDRVEVVRAVSGAAAYFAATVIRAPAMSKKLVFIEYETLRIGRSIPIKEYVKLDLLRPLPPPELNRRFKVSDDVDAYRESDGCWVRGNVRAIHENSKYVVGFNGDGSDDRGEIQVDQLNLRLHREWHDGSWFPLLPEQLQDKQSEMELRRGKVKLRIKFSVQKPKEKFEKGTMVEVTSDEEGYRGSWYSGSIFNSLGNNKYIVEYLTLKRDDAETVPLRELIEAKYIRPFPPQLPPVLQFKLGDEVDAWYNEGWWVGSIANVLNGAKYIVFFSSSNEVLEFAHWDLRLHQDWINGKWINPSKEKSISELDGNGCREESKTGENEGRANPKFRKGMKVEVKSDEKGYEGSWYSATIVNYIGDGKYTVEYKTLKTDDETEFLKEDFKASDIRPCPPLIQRVYPYEPFEYVDAWYNDGWWSGQVYKGFSGMRYTVYFKATNEELEFEHSDLRPHQEWKNGEWVAASKDCNI